MPDIFTLQTVGDDRLAYKLGKLADGFYPEARREVMTKLGVEIVRVLRAEAPKRRGKLRDGIASQVTNRGNVTELRVQSAARYTRYVLEGRGPVIARHAQALRFEPGPPGSGFIYRKRVGPARANPFVRWSRPRLENAVLQAVLQIGLHIRDIWSHS